LLFNEIVLFKTKNDVCTLRSLSCAKSPDFEPTHTEPHWNALLKPQKRTSERLCAAGESMLRECLEFSLKVDGRLLFLLYSKFFKNIFNTFTKGFV